MTTMTRRELMQRGAAASAAVGLRGAKAQVSAGRTVTIEARPQAVSIDTATTAVVVVDMQNDFGTKGGMLIVRGSTSPAFKRLWDRLPMF
jgi:hypothetical protein